ncbi:OmpA family protein [Nonomuraea diastatica]|uniref:OmpA family protein n=1 Tax=Nonomuraea diastatica TaxID=1848329 RepID=A0A4R4W8W1_9ACTN|nr:OmpA family protein [Nonomuraea diastatica]TDD13467.1 OmpA family protein [Nonomuraea diastatica]
MKARVAVTTVSLIMLAGCTGSTPAVRQTTAGATKPQDPPPARQVYARKGTCDSGGSDVPFRVEIVGVERQAEHTRLRLAISLDGAEKHHDMAFFGQSDFRGFRLLDPVGRRLYRAKSSHQLDQFGWYYKDIRYETEIYYDPLPASAGQITVIAPCTFGEMTGIPVAQGELTQSPTPLPTTSWGDDKPGTKVVLGADPPAPGARPNYSDLYAVEDGAQEKSTGTDEESIALRADVLFAFDKADLSAKARQVLDDVAEETRRRADPSKPPVTIAGHTDSKGDDPYNLRLSLRRAQTVRSYLSRRLGTDYQYKAEGKGETQPVAEEGGSNDKQASAKNRRVEVSYKIKQVVEATGAPSPGATAAPLPGTPAPFQEGLGRPVAERKNEDGWLLRVHQPYRDGAFMVGVYEIVNETGGWEHNITPRIDGEQPGSMWGGLTWLDPASGRRQRIVRVGKYGTGEDGYTYVAAPEITGKWGFGWAEHVPYRIYAYYAPPPPGVTALTLDAGPYGTFPDVPVK